MMFPTPCKIKNFPDITDGTHYNLPAYPWFGFVDTAGLTIGDNGISHYFLRFCSGHVTLANSSFCLSVVVQSLFNPQM
jgi:hypothetical protein